MSQIRTFFELHKDAFATLIGMLINLSHLTRVLRQARRVMRWRGGLLHSNLNNVDIYYIDAALVENVRAYDQMIHDTKMVMGQVHFH